MRVLTLLIPAALAAGCGKTDPGPVVVHPVKGQVLYEGKPVAGVEVTLLPTDAPTVPKIPRNPHGVTDSTGRFTIGTFEDGDGAAEGGYQIICHWPRTAPGADGEEEVETANNDRLLGWYDGLHSKFNVRVPAGGIEIPALKLDKHTGPPPKSEGVPGRN
ncbi:MAG: hypothetical protein J0I06_19420 [Planctomycetes bacterium]|nr:hypothetical protein [Planctomycetota bacterium]